MLEGPCFGKVEMLTVDEPRNIISVVEYAERFLHEIFDFTSESSSGGIEVRNCNERHDKPNTAV